MTTLKETLMIIGAEAIAWDLDIEQAIDYIAAYDPRNSGIGQDHPKYVKISQRTWRRYREELSTDDTLNQYFNHHTRVGFIQQQKKRMEEAELILKHLKARFLALSGVENVDVYRLSRLSETIATWSKRAEEISLANPVIAKIKMEVELRGNVPTDEETGTIPAAIQQNKFG